MTLTEHTIQRPGLTLHYWTGGPPSAPLVVFTHGATIDHTEWRETLPRVAQSYRVLAWDMRGHGRSRPAPFSMPAALDDLLAILDALAAPPALFVGHSLGGNLHQELAFYQPGRVRALFCLDCTWNFQRLTTSERVLLKLAGPIFALYPYRSLVEQSLRATAIQPAAREALRPAMLLHSKAEFTTILMASTRCLHYEPGYAIGKPLLLMVGDLDATGNIRKAMPAWAAAEPHARLVIVPGASHSPNLDAPDTFHAHLLEFLREHAA